MSASMMPSAPTHPAAAAPSTIGAETTIKLAVLDDDEVDLEAFRRCVASLKDRSLDVRLFQTADALCEGLLTDPCDLLFVDYHLNGGTGLTAREQLRKAGIDPPAVLVTNGKGEEVVRDAVLGGFLDYIPKRSVIPEVLTQVIRSSLEKARLQRDIEQKQRDLEATVDALQASRKEIRRFYHSVSHELKTPLTGAREFVSLVRDRVVGSVTEEQDDLLSGALRNCDRMVTCINDMLDASRIETGKLVLKPVVCDLGAVIRDAVKSLQGLAQAKGIETTVTLEPEAPLGGAFVDPDRIFQVVANLVSNAIKFTPSRGSIGVTARASSTGDLLVSVKDSGCGLSDSDQLQVFEHLFQSRNEDASALGGLGMGLFICRDLVRLHGGEISVKSEEGAGAEFMFSIPCVPPTDATLPIPS